MSHPIVTAARGWIGTRFHHQGRLKKTGKHKGGVDCLGLLAGVAAELDLRGPDGKPLILADETDYPHMPDVARLREKLGRVLKEILFFPLPPGEGGAKRRVRAVQHMDEHSLFHCPHPNPLPEGEGILQPGDIVLLRIDGSPQHLAIVSDFSTFSLLPSGEGGAKRRVRAVHHTDNHSLFHRPHPNPLPEGEGIGLGLIHAYAPARAVVEHALDDWWRERIEAAFRVQ